MKAAITIKIAASEEAFILKSEAEKMRFDAAETLHKAIQMLKETEEKQLSLSLSLPGVELCELATQVRINISPWMPSHYISVCVYLYTYTYTYIYSIHIHLRIHTHVQFVWSTVIFGPRFWVSHSSIM